MSKLEVDAIEPQSGTTLTLGASGDTINVAAGATNNLGITMADQWRLTANTNTGTASDITTNWERNDSTGYTGIGTGLTESSGIFSFPQTGYYLIDYSFTMQVVDDASAEINFKITVNNSTYFSIGETFSGIPSGAGNQTCSNTNFINVTDISTVKFIFATSSFAGGTYINGNTGEQRSGFSIFRIGDSQ